MDNQYSIKEISNEGNLLPEAMDLVWQVFSEFEAPDYSDEGIKEFKDFIAIDALKQRISNKELCIWACFDAGKIVGVMASRPPCHISLLFVDKRYHYRGIARSLYSAVLDFYKANSDYKEMTVNSSPYAAEAYRKLGFVDTDSEQTVNGLRFIPMKHVFR